ncbi:MAG: flavin reductase family protein [Candidatus Bathyarchaeia archaeon]
MDLKVGELLNETVRALNDRGLLLASVGRDGRPNVMTIGWGFVGYLWSKPYFIVAVRPSRHTYRLIKETGDFTVNVPSKGMEDVVDYCGTVSGRIYDKFKAKKLTPVKGRYVNSPIIDECILHYECKVNYESDLESEKISEQEES